MLLKTSCLQAGVMLLLWMLSGCAPAQDRGGDESVFAFTNVNVIPMDSERILEDQTVIVRNDEIAEVGPSGTIDIPVQAEKVDGSGFYLLPGLTDFHIHLRSTHELISYLYYGVTTVVQMSGATGGAPDLLHYRDAIEHGRMRGPRLFATGPSLDGDPPIFAPVSTVVTTPEEARGEVARQKEAGFDFIKVYNNVTPEVLNAITEAAGRHDMAVFGHIPRQGGRDRALQRALEAGLDMIAHSEEHFFTYFHAGVDSMLDLGQIPYRDESRIPAAVQMTKEAGTAITPNLSFVAMTRKQLDSLETVLEDPETRYLHPAVREMWRMHNPTRRSNLQRFDMREQAKYDFLKKFTAALNDAGILLLLGTDASIPGLFPGRSAHLELRELVNAGLSPYEALLTGTRNPGRFIRDNLTSAKPFGVIGPGQQADMILVEGNPLEDINNVSNIRGVMVRGKWLPEAELKAQREKIAENYVTGRK